MTCPNFLSTLGRADASEAVRGYRQGAADVVRRVYAANGSRLIVTQLADETTDVTFVRGVAGERRGAVRRPAA